MKARRRLALRMFASLGVVIAGCGSHAEHAGPPASTSVGDTDAAAPGDDVDRANEGGANEGGDAGNGGSIVSECDATYPLWPEVGVCRHTIGYVSICDDFDHLPFGALWSGVHVTPHTSLGFDSALDTSSPRSLHAQMGAQAAPTTEDAYLYRAFCDDAADTITLSAAFRAVVEGGSDPTPSVGLVSFLHDIGEVHYETMLLLDQGNVYLRRRASAPCSDCFENYLVYEYDGSGVWSYLQFSLGTEGSMFLSVSPSPLPPPDRTTIIDRPQPARSVIRGVRAGAIGPGYVNQRAYDIRFDDVVVQLIH